MSLPYVDDVALQENIVKTKEHVEGVRSALDSAKQNKMEFSTMPNAVASLEGLAVIYTGQTNVTYTQGSIYLCQEVTPATDPKTYEWVELTVPIEMDSALDNTSTNGIQNQAVTNALQALQNGVTLIYASESALPSIVNYAGGVIVAVGTVGYCVQERTWHKVTAINSSSLAITWSAFNPNIAVEDVNLLPSISSDLVVAQKTYILKGTQTGYQTGGIYEAKANTVTPEGTENPSEEGWYELSGGSYILSEDTEVASGKTYYALEWVLISANPLTFDTDDFTVTNDNVSLQPSRRMFNGTKAQYEALSADEKKKYDYLASPETVDGEFDVYSTSEVKTNKVWIDGKPIYRKVVDIGTLPNSTYKRTNHGISNLDFVVALYGVAQAQDGHKTTITLPWSDSSTVASNISLYADNTNIVVSTGGDMTTYVKNRVTIEYTKTTD